MKSDKILKMIPRLENLNEEDLETINKALDACIIVQTLKNIKINGQVSSNQIN